MYVFVEGLLLHLRCWFPILRLDLDLECRESFLNCILIQWLPLTLIKGAVKLLKDRRLLLRSPEVVLSSPFLRILALAIYEMRQLVLNARNFSSNLYSQFDLLQALHGTELLVEDCAALALADASAAAVGYLRTRVAPPTVLWRGLAGAGGF